MTVKQEVLFIFLFLYFILENNLVFLKNFIFESIDKQAFFSIKFLFFDSIFTTFNAT